MIEILIAGVIGALALGVYLLFRQLRTISWQLTQLRVEHDSERILHAIGVTSTAVHARPYPIRRKRHLALYLGGGAAVLAFLARNVRLHPAAAATAGGVALAAAAATVVTLAPRPQEYAEEPPFPMTSVTPTEGPLQDPTTDIESQPSSSPNTQGKLDWRRVPAALAAAESRQGTVIPDSPGRPTPSAPSPEPTGGPTETEPTPPPAPDPTAPTPPFPTPSPTSDGLCVVIALPPVVESDVCLLGRR
ncbi:hypothetical protein ACIOWI_29435 [Streptomyces sp. NPDC087659]|uniref:hypothetical protein n=1 Tax=Streptomyces sp. NPDC087659 TaxID=3365801 RepID=UPI003806F14A